MMKKKRNSMCRRFCIVLLCGMLLLETAGGFLSICLVQAQEGKTKQENTVYHGGLQENMPKMVDLYSSTGTESNWTLTENCGVQFHAVTEFNRFELYLSNVSLTKGGISLALYRWKNNIAETLAGDALASQTYERPRRQEWLALITDGSWEAGEYYVVFRNLQGMVAATVATPPLEQVRSYEQGSVFAGNFKCRIQYRHTPNQELGPLSEPVSSFAVQPSTWVATDGLGRTLSTSETTGSVREGKTVGLFFHTWHGNNALRGSRNITSILKEHPEIQNDYESPYWGDASTTPTEPPRFSKTCWCCWRCSRKPGRTASGRRRFLLCCPRLTTKT